MPVLSLTAGGKLRFVQLPLEYNPISGNVSGLSENIPVILVEFRILFVRFREQGKVVVEIKVYVLFWKL